MNQIQHIYFPSIGTVPKVWGEERILINGEFCGKFLRFNKGFTLSEHMHWEKQELFHLLSGKIIFKWRDYDKAEKLEKTLLPGDQVFIPRGNFHQVHALEDSIILEISSFHADCDSYRLEKSK